MAGRNDFLELKKLGKKEVKFKQGIHIDACYKGNVLSAPVYTKVKGGICAALTCDWLQEKIYLGVYVHFKRGSGDKSADDTHNEAVISLVAPDQQWFHDLKQELPSVSARTSKLAARYNLKLDVKDKTHGIFIEQVEYYVGALRTKQGAFFTAEITDTKNSTECTHALGFARLLDLFYFFDSNVGAYELTATQIRPFFQKYVELLKSKLSWDLHHTFGYLVVPE